VAAAWSCERYEANWLASIFTAGGTRISLQYKTVFANGEGDEQFLFFLTDSRVILQNYDLQSPLLIDK